MAVVTGNVRTGLAILGGIIAVFGVFCIFYFTRTKYDHYTDLFELKYGEDCNWEIEKKRVNLSITLSRVVYAEGDGSIGQGVFEMALQQEFLAKGEPFCNIYELLTCNRTTGTCDCGDPFAPIFSRRPGSVKFVKERGDKCRWGHGSFCFPKKLDSSMIPVEYECQAGTTCKSVSSSEECTNRLIIEHYTDVKEEFLEDMYSGKVCTCQSDHALLAVLTVLHP